MAYLNQMYFLNPMSVNYYNLTLFHNYLLFILSLILIVVSFVFYWILNNYWMYFNMMSLHSLEILWTFLPMMILLSIACISLVNLYKLEDFTWENFYNMDSYMFDNLKVYANQWFWSYQMGDSELWNQHLMPIMSLNNIYNLDVDNVLMLNSVKPYMMNITSKDVIHSWALPMLGVKLDATPGRLNFLFLYSNMPGFVYGQCSEICGANHSFMPISVEII